jgi:hypothetical protein
LEAPNVDRALGQVIASDHSFDVWYRERLQELHGITLVVALRELVQTGQR